MALDATKPALERAQELGIDGLLASPLPHELVLDRVERVDVGARERRDVRIRSERVAMSPDVSVDPRQVDVDVVQYGSALGPVGQQHAGLLGDLPLGLSAGGEAREAADQADRALSGSVDRRDPPDVARFAEQGATILGHDPPRPPGDVVAGPTVDVRDVEAIAVEPYA